MDFIPDSVPNRYTWLRGLKEQVNNNATELKLSAADLTAFNALIDPMIALYKAVIDAQAALDEASGNAQDLFGTSVAELRAFLNALKTNPAFTKGMGDAMKIFSTDSAPAEGDIKPVIKVEPQRGFVRISGTKNYAERVNLYLRRKNGAWVLVASSRKTFPFDDQTPLLAAGVPEEREYMARGVNGDSEVGQDSAIVSCTFAG